MHVGERVGHPGTELSHLGGRDRPVTQPAGQGRTIHELQDHERITFVLASVEHPNQPGVAQSSERDRFVPEPVTITGGGSEHLHRDPALELAILRLVHLTHAAPGDEAAELVSIGQDRSPFAHEELLDHDPPLPG